jgi:riboflavin kinase/FMN adenylyltransferase
MRLTGVVESGAGQAGAVFSLPTANIADTSANEVKPGVYAAKATIGGHEYEAVTFIGRAELLPEKPWRVETHLLNYEGDLVGQTLALDLLKHLRDPIVFTSTEQAREVMAKDLEQVRSFFTPNP